MPKDAAPAPRIQAEKFADLARELECDESPEAFEAAFGKIVPPKREGEKAAPKPKTKADMGQ